MMSRTLHVVPPSLEKKIGDRVGDPPGLGVNEVPAISCTFAGFTARLGSLSWLVSPLSEIGIMLTTVIKSGISTALLFFANGVPDLVQLFDRQEVERIDALVDRTPDLGR